MLGRKARFEEGGVFASNGYVTQHTELKQVYETLDLMSSASSYAIRLLAGSSPMDSDGLPEKQVYLNLPATQEALDHVLEVCEAPSWREMLFWTEDGAVPDLLENMDCDDTDLVLQGTGRPKLIRRLTPLECERLQGFPDNWTAIPNASDSSRYKALGNSVAIPCVDYVLHGISLVLLAS